MSVAGEEEESGADVALDTERPDIANPAKWAVLLHNDDYTTMEFVIEVLRKFFRKSGAEATEIMLKVHNDGRGVAGIYSREIAETKVQQVCEYAKANGHPLRCTTQPVEQ